MKVAVIGDMGMLGRAVVEVLRDDDRVIVRGVPRPPHAAAAEIDALGRASTVDFGSRGKDASAKVLNTAVLDEFCPDVVVNAAGAIPQRASGAAGSAAAGLRRDNEALPAQLASWALEFAAGRRQGAGCGDHRRDRPLLLVHISTDCIFEGADAMQVRDEHCAPDATALYGRTKHSGEKALTAGVRESTGVVAVVLRTSIVGEEWWRPQDRRFGLLEWARGRSASITPGYSDHYWNGVTCLQLGRLIHAVASRPQAVAAAWGFERVWRRGGSVVRHYVTPGSPVNKALLLRHISDVYGLFLDVVPGPAPQGPVFRNLSTALPLAVPNDSPRQPTVPFAPASEPDSALVPMRIEQQLQEQRLWWRERLARPDALKTMGMRDFETSGAASGEELPVYVQDAVSAVSMCRWASLRASHGTVPRGGARIDRDDSSRGRVTIVGGSGSLGWTLTRRLLDAGCTVQVVSRDELKQHLMEMSFAGERLVTHLGDMRDRDAILRALRWFDPHVVVLAAALKQIERCESSPHECVLTNVDGIDNCLDACVAVHSETGSLNSVLFVSSDKATEPSSVYGMTKALAERMVVNQARRHPEMRWLAVRYGNVVASRGSLLPRMHEVASAGHDLSLTSPQMTRFVMTLDQSVQLIENAMLFGSSGDTFVPGGLRAIAIKDVVEAFAAAYGVGVRVTGMRAGEKVHESLVSPVEALRTRRCAIKGLETLIIKHSWAVIDESAEALADIGAGGGFTSDRAVVDDATALLAELGADLGPVQRRVLS